MPWHPVGHCRAPDPKKVSAADLLPSVRLAAAHLAAQASQLSTLDVRLGQLDDKLAQLLTATGEVDGALTRLDERLALLEMTAGTLVKAISDWKVDDEPAT